METGQRFCQIPSRLFSGDPSALLCQLSDFQNIGTVASLSSPFEFSLDTDQVPSSQFWHVPKIAVQIYSPNAVIANLTPATCKLFLCPPSMVGAQNPVGQVNINTLGVDIDQLGSDLLNNGAAGWGYQTIFFETPIDVPPLWFLRFTILDENDGANVLPANSQVYLRFQRQIIPVNFAKLY